jgi:hypothetical protein
MNTKNFMNVVRFKSKSDCVDKYFEVITKTSFEGMTQRYIAKTGNYDYCFVGIWKSAEAMAAQRPAFLEVFLNFPIYVIIFINIFFPNPSKFS